MSDYSSKIQRILKEKKISVGCKVHIQKGKETFEGILMPRTAGDSDVLILKLGNGYNVGVEFDKKTKITRIGRKIELEKFPVTKMPYDKKKPTITILHTGGTVASRVDYRTGAVFAAFKPEELLTMFPELGGLANIKSRLIRSMWSEDMRTEHYQILGKEVVKEIKEGTDGIIITHGTDTLHFTSAALSFMLPNLPIPVILVGSQRSSDRGSSDAGMNLICATKFITRTDFAGVTVCMHGTMEDDFCYIHHPCKVRKCHTSRRDAFQPVNDSPYAKIWYKKDKIEFLRKDYPRKNRKKQTKLLDKFERKVGLIKTYTDFDPGLIKYFEKQKYKGLVLEGTGLGHIPINEIDEFTKINRECFNTLKRMVRNGCIVVMTSQCLWGRTNMNVYTTGRDLQDIGVIPGIDMLPEVAYIKLKWLLGNFSLEKAKKLITENLRGEINERSPTGFIKLI